MLKVSEKSDPSIEDSPEEIFYKIEVPANRYTRDWIMKINLIVTFDILNTYDLIRHFKLLLQ